MLKILGARTSATNTDKSKYAEYLSKLDAIIKDSAEKSVYKTSEGVSRIHECNECYITDCDQSNKLCTSMANSKQQADAAN